MYSSVDNMRDVDKGSAANGDPDQTNNHNEDRSEQFYHYTWSCQIQRAV